MIKKVAYWLLYSLFCITALIAGSIAGLMNTNPLVKYQVQDFFNIGPSNPFEYKDEFFILLLGCDEDRSPGNKVVSDFARTDSIHLIRLDFKNEAIGMLQVPRDIVVEMPGYRRMRMNALHVVGGPELTERAIEKLLNIRPDRTIVLNYDALRKIVNTVGGVEVFVEKRMKYTDRSGGLYIDIQPGRQHMDGDKAIEYIRYRRDSDIDRGRRQQEFMMAFQRSIFENSDKLGDVLDQVLEITSSGLSDVEVHHLAKFVKKVPTSRIKHGTLPVRDIGNYDLALLHSELENALVESGIKTPKREAASLR